MDLGAYRAEAEAFTAELSGEYHRHFAGLQEELGIEEVYARHAGLFAAAAGEELRAADGAADGEEARARRLLLDFCVEGHIGLATKELEAELARREVEATLAVDGRTLGFRESSVAQANEPDPDRRAAIEAARLEAMEAHINPVAREMLERFQALARELGWPSYRAMCEELKGLDLDALAAQTRAFLAASEEPYEPLVDPELRRTVGVGLADLRRSDLARFFRVAEADGLFPEERLVPSFRETLAGLGIDLAAQPNVILDVERRPQKSPRAFCAPVRVPGEVPLVGPPIGGRDDYLALFHEGGHAEHFGSMDPGLRWEFRQLGDYAVTEAFAFLLEHLVAEPAWMRARLGIEDAGELRSHNRAQRLVMLRRYCGKLEYELELHGGAGLDGLPERYAGRLTQAVRVPWPAGMWLTDVDPGFYVANYLRAWSLETHLRAVLHERFGELWFEEPEAGEFLVGLWRQGQRLSAEEMAAELGAGELDFGAVLKDLALAA